MKTKSYWPYSSNAPNNKLWRKHRDELFEKNGNGWWYTQGVNVYDYKLKYQEKLERLEREKNNAKQK